VACSARSNWYRTKTARLVSIRAETVRTDRRAAYENRLIFRAFGDNILGFAPALSYTEAEFDLMFERLEKTLDDVLAQADVRAALKVKIHATAC
jgi:Adenosylmethionine-8-amino-7-oxononanoate aminotransferase